MTDTTSGTALDNVFRPPPRGDVTLRSSDGVEFLVHSAILNLASPVFESLSVVGTTKDVVELSETAETISLMLRFIYPNEMTPIMTSFDMLSQCLQVAQKYDLEGMLRNIDQQLAIKEVSQSLIHQDPLRAYELSEQFGLPDTKALATPLVVTSETDFSDPQRLAELIKSHPSTSVIRLAAIQSTRGKMIADVLLKFYEPPILPSSTEGGMFYTLSCDPCKKWLNECFTSVARSGICFNNPPSWVVAWVQYAYQALLHASLEKSDELFEWTVLQNFEGNSRVCQDCLAGFTNSSEKKAAFRKWSQGVKDILKRRLEGLQYLYAL